MTQRKYRRIGTTTALLVTATLALSGCGSSEGAEATGKVAGPIQYGFWGNADRTKYTAAVSELFMAKNPGTKVEHLASEYQAYIERLTVQASSGELPCVTQTQSTFASTYMAAGVLRPLDDLIKSGAIDISGIPEEILETGRADGKQYTIPVSTFLRLIAYNAAMGEDYGVEPLAKSGTYEDYRKWALQAQAKLPAGTYAAENEGANLFTLYNWVAGHGKQMFDGGELGFDQQLLVEYFEFWEELRKAGAATPADRLDEQFGALEVTPLARGIALSSTRDIAQFAVVVNTLKSQGKPSELAFLRQRVEPSVQSGNVPGTNGLSISTSCDNVSTAAEYIDFFANDVEGAQAFQSNNSIVISPEGRKALLEDQKTSETVRKSLEVFTEITDDGDIAAATYPSGYQTLQPLLRRLYENVAFGKTTAADAAATFFTQSKSDLK